MIEHRDMMMKKSASFTFSLMIVAQLVAALIPVAADLIFQIYPSGDITLLSGSDLDLNCTVTNSSYNVENITMNFWPNKTKGIDIDESLITRIQDDNGQRSLLVHKSNVSFEDSGFYRCLYKNEYQSEKMVTVNDLPRKPENISCVSYNFWNLSCSATLPLRPSDLPMSWTLKYTLDSENQEKDCAVEPLGESLAILNCQPFEYLPHFQNYTMTFYGRSSRFPASEVVAEFSIMGDYSLVKPGPVEDLQVTLTDDSGTVTLTWSINSELMAAGMMLAHRIKLVSLQDWEPTRWLYLHNFELTQSTRSLSLNLTNLIPNARYMVFVSCKPEGASGELYWSDVANTTFTTNISFPGESVSLTNGSFLYIPGQKDRADIILYWKNPPDKLSHGIINEYQIEIEEHSHDTYSSIKMQESDDLNVTVQTLLEDENTILDNRYMKVLVLEDGVNGTNSHNLSETFNKYSSYTVRVWAGNDAGLSEDAAVIEIPTWNQVAELLPRWVITEVDRESDRTLVSWDNGNRKFENVSIVTVYSCLNDGEQMSCQDLSWYSRMDNNSEMWVNVSGEYNFAVSMTTSDGISGGMVWQSLAFIHGRAPAIPLYSVNSDQTNPTRLNITVNHAAGSEGRPELFKVAVERADSMTDTSKCPSNVKLKEYPVDFTKTEIVVGNLDPGTEFVVCMKSGNNVGDSAFGRAVRIRTSSNKVLMTDDQSNAAAILGAVLGSLAFLLFVAFFICCVRRKYRSVKMNNKIEDPELKFDKFTYQKQNGLQMHEKPADVGSGLSKTDNKDSGTESGHASSNSSQDQEEGEGMVRDRRWSSVSNDSNYSQIKARRRNSSSGLSGYLRVDGDTSGLSADNEREYLMDSEDEQGEDVCDNGIKQGEINQYFDGREGPVRHYDEIDEQGDNVGDNRVKQGEINQYFDGRERPVRLYDEIDEQGDNVGDNMIQQTETNHDFDRSEHPVRHYDEINEDVFASSREDTIVNIKAFHQKPRNCSLKQAAVTRVLLKSDDKVHDVHAVRNEVAELATTIPHRLTSCVANNKVDVESTVDNRSKADEIQVIIADKLSSHGENNPPFTSNVNTVHNSAIHQGAHYDVSETSFVDMSTDITAKPQNIEYVPNVNQTSDGGPRSNLYIDKHFDKNSPEKSHAINKVYLRLNATVKTSEELTDNIHKDLGNEIAIIDVHESAEEKGHGGELSMKNEPQTTNTDVRRECQKDDGKEDSHKISSILTMQNEVLNDSGEERAGFSPGANFVSTSGEYVVEEIDSGGSIIMAENFDAYHNPETLSIGQGSSYSEGSNNDSSNIGSDDQNTNDINLEYDAHNDEPTDIIKDGESITAHIHDTGDIILKQDALNNEAIDIINESESTTTHTHDTAKVDMTLNLKNGLTVPPDKANQLRLLIEALPAQNDETIKAVRESEKSINESSSMKSQNHNSYDSYVCAGVGQSN